MIEEKYKQLCNTRSDINEHLPTLKQYASKCDHVTEFGVRGVVSTWALLAGKPKTLVSYDIVKCPVEGIKELALEQGTNFEFKVGSTLSIEIDPTDLLFIDTLHNYDQLKKELELHANKVSNYIIFHDTSSFEYVGESYDGISRKGIIPAIQEFLESNVEWSLEKRFFNNNGLTIIKKGV